MKINQFDKNNLGALRLAISAALEKVGEEYGIAIRVGNATYSDASSTFKLEMSVIRNGEVVTKEMETLKMYMPLLGLNESRLTQQFKLGPKTFVLHGYKPRKNKPMLIRHVSTDKIYCATDDAVLSALGVSKTNA